MRTRCARLVPPLFALAVLSAAGGAWPAQGAAGDKPDSAPAPGWWDRALDPDNLPFIPVPEIDTSPGSGTTVGLIPVVLTSNSKGQIDRILAPDIIHTEYFGWGARWRTFRNPSEDRKWSLVGGGKQRTEREFDWEEDYGLLRQSDWSWMTHTMYDRSGTGRFFGYGNRSPRGAETTFVNSQEMVEGSIGRNFSNALQLLYGVRLHNVEIENGALPLVPSIQFRFPHIPGVGDEREFQHRVELAYDSRDSSVIPTTGERGVAYAGFSRDGLLSTASYTFWGLDGSAYRSLDRDLVLAGHAAIRLMPSTRYVPFWALSSIGGDRAVVGSVQPLRAYVPGRYVDNNSFSASIELRRRVAGAHLFDTDLALEIDPFVDVGQVYHEVNTNPLHDLHHVAGIGFRMVASPFVVGYVDVGVADNHVAVFSGIDYPF